MSLSPEGRGGRGAGGAGGELSVGQGGGDGQGHGAGLLLHPLDTKQDREIGSRLKCELQASSASVCPTYFAMFQALQMATVVEGRSLSKIKGRIPNVFRSSGRY